MAIVVKTIRGRQYRYEQTSRRENGKVVTKSIYLGPLHPKRKRGGGLGLLAANILVGGLQLGAMAATGRLKTVRHIDKGERYDREKRVTEDRLRALDQKYGIDKTNAARFHETRARLPREMFDEYAKAERALWSGYRAGKESQQAKGVMSADMKEFADRLAALSGSGTAPSAPANSETEDAGADEGEAKD